MKNILFSFMLVASLVLSGKAVLADTNSTSGVQGQTNMNARELQTGLKDPILIQSGEESWILHQPKQHRNRYFTTPMEEDMVKQAEGTEKNRKG